MGADVERAYLVPWHIWLPYISAEANAMGAKSLIEFAVVPSLLRLDVGRCEKLHWGQDRE
jgi:hypothetical protein